MSRLCLLLALLLAAGPHFATSVSLLAKLREANHSTFLQLLGDTGLGTQLGSGTCSSIVCYLIFVPTDAAFSAAYPGGLSALTLDDKKAVVKNLYLSPYPANVKGTLANWPKAGTPVGKDIGFGQVQILRTEGGVLYWLRKQRGSEFAYHVNTAKLDVALSNKEGDNGVFHVLQRVPMPVGQQMALKSFFDGGNAALISQLKVSKSVQWFKTWMDRDTAKAAIYGVMQGSNPFKVRTLFLPSDAAWDALGTSAFASLNSSTDAVRRVLAAHFALNYTVFTDWMAEVPSINFTSGLGELASLPASMYRDPTGRGYVACGGVVAKFDEPRVNFPLSDAVVHVIDRPLAFLYNDLEALAQTHARSFYDICRSVSSCLAMLRSGTDNYTLFAPQSLSGYSALNATERERVLRLHFVPGVRIGRPQMQASLVLRAASGAGEIRFGASANHTRLWINARLSGRGYTTSELVRSDEPATNGMLHLVSSALGVPTSNVQEFVRSYAPLANVSRYIGVGDFDPALNRPSPQLTLFAPTNQAMDEFVRRTDASGNSFGRRIVDSRLLRDRVFRRMMLPNSRVDANTLPAGSYRLATANTVENEFVVLTLTGSPGDAGRQAKLSGAGVEAKAEVSPGPWECTNGLVYLADTVLARDSDVEGYTRAGCCLRADAASLLLPSLLLLLLLLPLAPRG